MPSRFEIVAELSRHGRAVLYHARDVTSGDEITLRRYLGDAEELEPLGQALAEIASLEHPNLERFIEIGEDDEGLFAIVDKPGGESLTDLLKRGPLTVKEFEQVAQQLLTALCALHEAGYAHLALRPGLVRIEPQETGELQLRLTGYGEGFGRASATGQADIATYRCCAPEHWLGEPVGRRTDVYALGCILYEALAGRPAFQGDTAETMRSAHLEHDVAPLERAAPHAPAWMTAWVMHLMEPSADQRVKNAMQARELYEQREASLASIAGAPQQAQTYVQPVMPPSSPAPVAYPIPTIQPMRPLHPVTAEVPSARATSSAIPVVIEGTGGYRRPAAPLRPAAKAIPAVPPPTTGRSKEEVRVLFSMVVAGVLVIAIAAYLFMVRQSATKDNDAASAPLTPIAAGLVLQLDADRPDTVFREASNSRIRRWKNATGKPPHLQQATRDAMPALLAKDLAGKSTMDFGPTNSGQWLEFTDDNGKPMNLAAIRSVFWVLKGSNFLLTDDNTTHFHRGDPEGSPTAKILRNPEAETMKVRLNGNDVSAAATALPEDYSIISAVTTKPLEASRLCKDRNEPTRRGGQQIAEILIYDRPLNAAEVAQVESYLRRKWFGQ